jgi:hypothetical protein
MKVADMNKRGRIPLEEKFGEERLKALLKSMDVPLIARLICNHQIGDEEKKRCQACRRSIYRAKERLESRERQDQTFEPIDEFEQIPEIKVTITYSEAKHLTHGVIRKMTGHLRLMWDWIRENPEFQDTQRPILWEEKHLVYILKKVGELNIGQYHHIQSLRRFFEANNRPEMLKHQLLRARAKDLRSPKGKTRKTDRFSTCECRDILSVCTPDEALAIQLHITLKSREGDKGAGSLLNLKWDDINWNDNYYGFETVTATVYEPKTGGGIYWEHCPIDLWWSDLSSRLKDRYEGKNSEYVIPYTSVEYQSLWNRISEKLGKDFEPHDCRRSPSGWLRDLGLSDLALGQVDMASGRGTGFTGVGWENQKVFFDRYGKMNPLAIYDKRQGLDTSMFNGLIKKILEQKSVPYL